jgi:hypothetical protein
MCQRIRALTRCQLDRDAGFTMADKTNRFVFCLSFARGCCGVGHECNYLHRIPMVEDEKHFTPLYDCFGRDKHMVDRYDMGGTGAFSRENRTLYVGGISAMTQDIENTVRNHFSDWGEIESIKVLPRKYVAFIKYTSRLNAEYAKEAMFGQSLGNDEILNVRWSTVDPNPKVKSEIQRGHEITFAKAFLENKSSELLTAYEMYDREAEQEKAMLDVMKRRKLEGSTRTPPPLVASAYPNTDRQYQPKSIHGSSLTSSAVHMETTSTVPYESLPVGQDSISSGKDVTNPSGRSSAISLLAHYGSEEENHLVEL